MLWKRSRRAVFFDKDGVINELIDRGPNFVLAGKPERLTAPWKIEELRFREEIFSLLDATQSRGYLAIVVTNQPDVRYGVMRDVELEVILMMVRTLGFEDIFVCKHGRDDDCECRKPKPAMLLAAAAKWNIDLKSSFFAGDMHTDVEAALAAGVRPILLDRPYNRGANDSYRIRSVQEFIAHL